MTNEETRVGRALRVDERELALDDDAGFCTTAQSVLATGHKGQRTVLADRRETLFDFPARPAGEWERLEDFDRL